MKSLVRIVHAHKQGPCTDCGGTFDPVCMDFDHRPGELKRANVSALARAGVPTSVLLDEIARCDLVCANCHRLRTKHRAGARNAAAPSSPAIDGARARNARAKRADRAAVPKTECIFSRVAARHLTRLA